MLLSVGGYTDRGTEPQTITATFLRQRATMATMATMANMATMATMATMASAGNITLPKRQETQIAHRHDKRT